MVEPRAAIFDHKETAFEALAQWQVTPAQFRPYLVWLAAHTGSANPARC